MSHNLKAESAVNKITGRVTGSKAATQKPPVYDRYMAENDLSTLARAQEIQKDRARMKAVKCCARDQMKTLAKVMGSKKK